jgi:NADPH:quinone reductase-like Zn-dependent oxidoreductase
MRAITYSEFGSTDVLTVSDIPEPRPGPDSVIVEVRAASINPVDFKSREGHLEGLIDTVFPAVPGWDVAGVVVKVGADAPEFEVGDEVYGYARKDFLGAGMLAERVSVPVRTLAHKPKSLTFEEAAAVPLVALTALRSLRRSAVAEGDRVLVHNGSGGVGGFAIQLARLAGASVVATASEHNHDYLRSLGATPVAYGEGLSERLAEVQPEGFDVVLDYAGGGSLAASEGAMREGARAISVVVGKEVRRLGGHVVWVRPDAPGLAELAELFDAGKLKVEVAKVYPLEEAAAAYQELEAGHVRGKIVVTP